MVQAVHARGYVGQAPNIVIWLKRTVVDGDAGAWFLDRISQRGYSHTHEVKFNSPTRAKDDLTEELWHFLQSYLPSGHENFVLTARETVFETNSVLLSGLEVTGHKVTKGVQRVLVTFRSVMGTLKSIFAPNRAPNLLDDARCDLSARTLSDVILPALNLAATEPTEAFKQSGHRIEAFVDRLKENKSGIEFYATLLSRYVAARERSSTIDLSDPPRPYLPRQHYTRSDCAPLPTTAW
ncbi:MAG: hypothetical protein AAF943_04590 [Pseudomonadota bacterium]